MNDTAPRPVPTTGQALELDLLDLHECPFNARQELSPQADAELVASVRDRGVLQPILVRGVTVGGVFAYQVVCGHRRFRAARAVGLAKIPAVFRDLDDAQARVVQMEENLQREDLSPLDEAEGFAQLRAAGMGLEEMAAATHKSAATVRQRLKLLDLPVEALKGLKAGKLTLAVCSLIARIPDPGLQKRATKDMLEGKRSPRDGRQRPYAFEEASEIIRSGYMTDLTTAPFSAKDADLLPEAGACTACPHRTGNDQDLFGDILKEGKRGGDICTNPTCFSRKKKAFAEREVFLARDAGQRVLTPKEAKKVFPYASGYLDNRAGFIDQDDKNHSSPGGKTWKALLGDSAPEPVLAVDPEGTPRRLYPRALAEAALKAKYPWARGASSQPKPKPTSAELKRKQDEAFQVAVNDLVLKTLTSEWVTANLTKPNDDQWRALACGALGRLLHDDARLICKRRELVVKGKSPTEQLHELAAKASGPQLTGLLLEVLLLPLLPAKWRGSDRNMPKALAAFGIDVKAIEAKLRKEAAEATKPQPKAKPAPKAKPRPAKTDPKKATKAWKKKGVH